MKKGDKWIIGTLIILLILSTIGMMAYQWTLRGNKEKAIIKQNKKIIDQITLSDIEESIFWEVIGEDGAYNKIEAKNNQIRFIEANCPDQVCVQAGWIPKGGNIAVCLPNRVSIEIDQHQILDVDDVTY
ncbi:MAG: NusG domain II-containing protein [Epulopiscium sp.]|nr:NusG domain II-containing protein [Candidatus Epulonipiscium sp.]